MSRHESGHGGEVYAIARRAGASPDSYLDFSSNANMFAAPITAELAAATPYPFAHYPDSTAGELVEAIAAHEGVEAERILPGNGAAELIWLAVQALAPRKALCVGPIFSEFVKAFQAYDIPYEVLATQAENDFHCSDANLELLWNSDADLVVLCTPNNPAGVTYENISHMLQMLRAPRVLIDNSYREFLYGSESYAANHQNAYQQSARPGVSLFTLHSFTKFFCCPGIRLGYLMGDRIPLARMAALRPSWTVSAFAQVMGREFLRSVDRYRQTLPELYKAEAELARELRRLNCMRPERVFEGPGFVCCGLAQGLKASETYQKLLKGRMLVRDCDSIPGMPPGFIRLRARAPEENARLVEALEVLYINRSQ